MNKVKKYLLIGTMSVFIPGDERSRTNPGHGYPESTEHYPTLTWFESEEELISYLERRPGETNPEIYEIAGMVKVGRKVTTSLVRGD